MCKIAIIIPYFGKFPEWIDLFLYSCSRNAKISNDIAVDWLIFTDNDFPSIIYSNTIFYNTTFEKYCLWVSEQLQMDFKPDRPYKLCDLKPFYGIVHKEYLMGYTHWGFGDLDLCYANLSLLINKHNLNRYDLLTTHADRIAGHFTIIKIESVYTSLCLKIKDWRNKLKNEKVLGLDEMDFTELVRPMKNYHRVYNLLCKFYNIGIYDFMNIPNKIHNLYSKSLIKEFFTSPLPQSGEKWIWNIEKNCLLDPFGNELPYLHFLFFKKTPFWNTPNYWKKDFYCLSLENDFFKKNKGRIIFDNKSIIYAEN